MAAVLDQAATTLAVAGLPLDATARELKNFFRLAPGFEKAHAHFPNNKGPVLFVKFLTHEEALTGMALAECMCFDQDAQPAILMKAQFAKSELHSGASKGETQESGGDMRWVAPKRSAADAFGTAAAPSARRALLTPALVGAQHGAHGRGNHSSVCGKGIAAMGGVKGGAKGRGDALQEIDTLACKFPAGQDVVALEEYFERFEGYVATKPTARNCFVKFETPDAARAALRHGQADGLEVSLARGSMKVGGALPEGGEAAPQRGLAPQQQQQRGGWPQQSSADCARAPQQQRHPTFPAEVGVDTLACKLPAGEGPSVLEEYFEVLEGYVATKPTARNCFIKFSSPDEANAALFQGQADGFEVSLARKSMMILDDSEAAPPQMQLGEWPQDQVAGSSCALQQPSWMPQQTKTASVDTLACKFSVGQYAHDLESYFMELEGYVAMKPTARNCFIKFDSPHAADAALKTGQADGLQISFARGSMVVGQQEACETVASPKRGLVQQRVGSRLAAASNDTLACKCASATEEDLEAFWCTQDGFVRLKLAGKNCFIKFETALQAGAALQFGQESGFEVQFARSVMQ